MDMGAGRRRPWIPSILGPRAIKGQGDRGHREKGFLPAVQNDLGPQFVSLFVKGVYAFGQLLTEIPETIKVIASKAYFQEMRYQHLSSPKGDA